MGRTADDCLGPFKDATHPAEHGPAVSKVEMSKLLFCVFACSGVLLAAQSPAPDPTAVLAAARTALGGEARLAAVKTITASGRTRQVRGENLVPIEFEMAIELPAKYVRKDEVPAQESGPTMLGFNGDDLIQEPPNAGPQGRPGGPPAPSPEQLAAANRARIAGVKQDFARLMLGMFATSFPSYPLTFTYVGQAEAPQGMADVLEAKGAANLTMRLFVYRETHMPVMVTWQGAPPGPGRGPGAGRGPVAAPEAGSTRGGPPDVVPGAGRAGGAGADRGAPPPALAPGSSPAPARGAAPPLPENRLYFADYRDVDGVKVPFRLRRAVGQDTVEETTFDRFRLNARIDAKKFEIRK